jgi:RimJ/RimL family protein N-acetyltransferase
MNDLRIAKLTCADALALSNLLTHDDAGYGEFFTPFPTELESVEVMLKSTKDDCYWGLWFGTTLVGFFMLRGFDEGYARPAYGVYIAKSFANKGLSKVALDYSICWCRLNGVRALMLKVHPDNTIAKRSYVNAGFKFVETCLNTGHHVMQIDWEG